MEMDHRQEAQTRVLKEEQFLQPNRIQKVHLQQDRVLLQPDRGHLRPDRVLPPEPRREKKQDRVETLQKVRVKLPRLNPQNQGHADNQVR